VEVTSATTSYLVNEMQVRDPPLNGRDFVQLVTLERNVIPARPSPGNNRLAAGYCLQ
jgi:hypothetical protein